MLRLVRELKQQSISKGIEDNSSGDEGSARPIETHRSAKLNSKRDKEHLRDSGTESDEEELEEIALKSMASLKNYEDFLSGGSPPAIFSSPPLASEIDTESWDSFGRESGILTGDGDSDSEDCTTPRP
uniref:SNX2 n=1 Tax=Heterorhabditis bacteriophora TaxID=37862 RepID=A0A1I7XL28_HETBA